MLPNNNWTPFEILNLFIDDFLDIVVEKTNQAFQFSTREGSRDEYFQILNRVELKKYIGILIMMGIQKLPEIESHWATHGMWNSNLITSTMSRNKFEAIGTYLSIGDPRSDKKLARTERLSEIINEKCRAFYSPRAELSIDESMIAYKGRHGLRQYIPMKPTKWGFKVFLLCERKTGYCIRHIFYDGPKRKNLSRRTLC